jgi:hypothetical protein
MALSLLLCADYYWAPPVVLRCRAVTIPPNLLRRKQGAIMCSEQLLLGAVLI